MIRAVDITAELCPRAQGRWHRFVAPDRVTVLTATPQPTDHSTAEDPIAG